MPDTLITIQTLAVEATELVKSPLKANKTEAIKKLRRIADLATTLAFTIEARRP